MNALRPFQISVPGDWSDAWLYMDELLLWDTEGYLFHIQLSKLTSQLRYEYSAEVAFAAEMLVFRSDWKGGIQSRAFQRVDSIADAIHNSIEMALQVGRFEIDPDSLIEGVPMERIPGRILATSVYAHHAFVASSSGLYELNVNPRYLDRSEDLLQRLDVPVHHVTANYGAVSTSAFEDGLWFTPIDLDGSGSWLSGGPMQRVAEYSRSTSTAARDLLNYTDDPVPDLFLADAVNERRNERSRYPSWQVRGYRKSEENLAAAAARRFDVDEGSMRGRNIEVLGNSKFHLLVDNSGALELLDMKTANGLSLVESNRAMASSSIDSSKLLSTHALADGFALEFVDSVRLIDGRGVTEIVDGPVANVRTFPGSRHFQDTLLAVRDADVLLVGLG